MMRNLFILLLISVTFTSQAQNQTWKYDFGESTSIFNPNPGTSSKKFLPKPEANLNKSMKQIVRIRTAGDGTGALSLVKTGANFFKGAGLEILAGTSTSKFAIYKIEGTSVFKNSFNLKFDSSKDVQWIYANGNSSDEDDVFEGNSNLKETSSEVFAGLRWQLTSNNEIALAYRNGSKWSTIKNITFNKDAEYTIDVYSNNSSEDKAYTKDGNQTIKAGTSQLWINGKKLEMELPTAGLVSGKVLDAFIILGYKSKSSNEEPKVWIDNVEYSNNL